LFEIVNVHKHLDSGHSSVLFLSRKTNDILSSIMALFLLDQSLNMAEDGQQKLLEQQNFYLIVENLQ